MHNEDQTFLSSLCEQARGNNKKPINEGLAYGRVDTSLRSLQQMDKYINDCCSRVKQLGDNPDPGTISRAWMAADNLRKTWDQYYQALTKRHDDVHHPVAGGGSNQLGAPPTAPDPMEKFKRGGVWKKGFADFDREGSDPNA